MKNAVKKAAKKAVKKAAKKAPAAKKAAKKSAELLPKIQPGQGVIVEFLREDNPDIDHSQYSWGKLYAEVQERTGTMVKLLFPESSEGSGDGSVEIMDLATLVDANELHYRSIKPGKLEDAKEETDGAAATDDEDGDDDGDDDDGDADNDEDENSDYL